MSKHEFEGAPVPADATQLRHVLPRTGEREVIAQVPPLPQPRTATPDPFTEATIARVPSEVAPSYGDEAATGVTAVRPAGASSGGISWGSGPSTPTPAWSDPAPTPPPPPAWQQSAPVPAQPLPPRKEDTKAALLGVLIAAIVLIAGGGGFYLTWSHQIPTSASSSPTTDFSGSLPAGGASSGSNSSGSGASNSASTSTGSDTSSDTSSSSSVGSSSAPTTEAAPSVDPEAAALDQLTAMRNNSVARVALDGRWVAQVASKSVGITDPLQQTQTGGHTFMAADILAESMQARSTVANPDQNVYVLWGTDFGKRSQAPNGSPYWITLVDAGFGSSKAVTTWCQTTYSSLTPAQLADTCAPRQLSQPHS